MTFNAVTAANTILSSLMQIVDSENEWIATVNPETEFTILKHYYKRQFMGFNIYIRVDQDLLLLDTQESMNLAKNIVGSICKGLAFGAGYYRLPG